MKTFSNKNHAGFLISGVFFTRVLLILAILGFLLRFLTGCELAALNNGINSVLSPGKASDLFTYMKLGQEIARGVWPEEFYYQPFYYAVFLPLIYLCSGFSIWAVVAVQSLLGGATVWFAGLTGRELGGRLAGLTAAFFTALSTPLLLYAPFHQNETLQCFNLTLLAFLGLKALRRKKYRYWAGAGAVAGIAILTRGNINLFLPLFIVLLLFTQRRSTGWKCAASALFLGMALLLQLPFIIYNTNAKKSLTGPSTAANAVLALGNTPEAPPGGRNAGLPAGPMEYPESFHRFMDNASRGTSVPVQMFQWMSREPGAFFELQFRKLLLFWDFRELPNNVSLYGEGQHSMVLRFLPVGRSGVLLSMAAAGMIFFISRLRRPRPLSWFMLYGMVIIYWGSIALFYILSRFRAPVLPLTSVFAGLWISLFISRWKKWERQQRYAAALIMFCGVFITFGAYDFYGDNLEKHIMRQVRPAGTMVDSGIKPRHLLDHGPFSCGGWNAAELHSGMTLKKYFALPPGKGRIRWQIMSENSGSIIIKVNGSEMLQQVEKGMNQLEFPAENPVHIEVISASGIFSLYDRRRDYRRSEYNNSRLPGEWIMRFIF